MDETQRSVLDAFLTLYKQQMEHFRHTQQLEWRANFGIWTLLAGAIYIVNKEVVQIPYRGWLIALVPILLFAAALLHVLWLLKVHRSEDNDRRFWRRYRAEALQGLRGGSTNTLHEDERPSDRKRGNDWQWIALEGMVTVLLCVFLFSSLSTRSSAAEHQYVVERVKDVNGNDAFLRIDLTAGEECAIGHGWGVVRQHQGLPDDPYLVPFCDGLGKK
jgi:hypothetical protein